MKEGRALEGEISLYEQEFGELEVKRMISEAEVIDDFRSGKQYY